MKKVFFRLNWILFKLFLKLSFVFGGLSLFAFPAGDNFNNQQSKESENSREKIYLHSDGSSYIAGEDIWFKVYLVDANTNKPEALSKIVYVDLIDPANKIIETKIIKIINGCCPGDFKLPVDLIKGEYTLRAYTNFMRNFNDAWFFRKRVYVNALQSGNRDSSEIKEADKKADIPLQTLKPDLQFFPDGGYIVDGLVNRIGFKALGPDGKGIDISGAIVDNTGEKVIEFKTMKFGLGMLKFVPQKDKSYKAHITFGNEQYTYDLPVSLTTGVVMEMIDQKDFYTAIIRSSLPNGVNDFKFIGRQREKFFGSSKIVNNLNGAKITIPKNILDEGIVQFTLFDSKGNPLCERLVFVDKSKDYPIVTVSPSKKEYSKRELVELDLSLDIPNSSTSTANSSVSVADISTLNGNQFGVDIRSYLLLNSDLRGEIEQPGYYFYSDDPHRKEVLDLLMMTQGWRQFILNDSLNENGDKLKFAVETGIRIGGTVRRYDKQGKPVKAGVSLTYSSKDEMVYNTTETDNQGHFLFDDFDFSDSTSVIVQAKKLKKGSNEKIQNPNTSFCIIMDSLISPKLPVRETPSFRSEEASIINYPVNRLTDAEIDSILRAQPKHILLDEVTILAKKKERMSKKRSMYIEPSNTLDFKEMRKGTAARNVLDALQGRIPGLDFNGDDLKIGGDSSLNGGGPLFLLNGIPTTKDAILSIPVDQIDFVDVLKRGKTIIFGSAGSHGVIAVYTLTAADNLDNDEKYDDKCILNFIHPGYSFARKFYEPKYSSVKSEENKEDYRSTLYWNPDVKLGEQGKTKISFHTSDLPATYKVDLEGITPEGIPFKSETTFDVK